MKRKMKVHLEATEQSIAQMLKEAAADLDGSVYVQTSSEIEAGDPLLTSCN